MVRLRSPFSPIPPAPFPLSQGEQPHPPLRGTHSQWERGKELRFREIRLCDARFWLQGVRRFIFLAHPLSPRDAAVCVATSCCGERDYRRIWRSWQGILERRGPYARRALSPKSPFPKGARGLLWGEHIGTRKRAYRRSR